MTEEGSYQEDLIRYRMERARQTLDATRKMRGQNADTASIINRSYYAMFYAALALLATTGDHSSKHSGMMSLFDRKFIKTGILPKEMSQFPHTAFDMRQSADYEDKAEISEAAAEQVFEFAVTFVASIENNSRIIFNYEGWLFSGERIPLLKTLQGSNPIPRPPPQMHFIRHG